MKLKTKKSYINHLSEGKPPRRILPRIIKFAYYIVLLGILGGICYVVMVRYLYFTGRGQVEIEKTKISSEHGGRINTIERQAGDRFLTGDILAVIDLGNDCPEVNSDIRLTRLTYDIRLKQSQYNLYIERLKQLERGQEAGILPRALEIGDAVSRRKHEQIKGDIKRLYEITALLGPEIAIKQQELATLEKDLAFERDAACGFQTVRSPFSGSVYHVTHKTGEYVKKGESLFVVIPEGADVLVEAFFDRKHLRYLAKGDKMTVEFPDRTTSVGEITDFFSSASYFPERTRKDYLPVEARLRANLKPATESEKLRWKLYDRIDVKVKGKK